MLGSDQARNTVPMAGRVLAVLEIFHACGPQLSFTEIVEACSIPKASTFRILETLRGLGYLTRSAGGRYRLTYKLFDVAIEGHRRNPLRRVALPYLNDLRNLFGTTVNLGVRQGDHLMYADTLESERQLWMTPAVGLHAAMHATALGKAIAARLPPVELHELIGRTGLPRFTENTITAEGALAAELARTREREYAVDEEEEQQGMYCVAMPILRPGSQPVWAISLCAPIARMNRERIARIVEGLKSASSAISAQFG